MSAPADLFAAALEARGRAHAPYSDFAVGAALRTAGGAIHAGCNVENASYPEGWCAETSAIAAMVGAGEREIAEVCVIGSAATPTPPCGGCRQRLAEFAGPEVTVHICLPDGSGMAMTMAALLPAAFRFAGPDKPPA